MAIILAIVGLPGAGKRVATEYLMQKTGWKKVYFGDITLEGLREQGLPITEENERKFREELRAKHGMGAYALLNLPKIKSIFPAESVLLESFYSWEEYLLMKQEFSDRFKALAIWAPPQIRQERLLHRPDRSLTKEEFVSRDYSQIENLHQAGPIARADFMAKNDSSLENFYKELDKILEQL